MNAFDPARSDCQTYICTQLITNRQPLAIVEKPFLPIVHRHEHNALDYDAIHTLQGDKAGVGKASAKLVSPSCKVT